MAKAKSDSESFITTTEDVERVISGDRMQINWDYPFSDPAPPSDQEKLKWYVAQPTDWVYDMAQAVREAAVSEFMALPEIEMVKTLPPTAQFVRRQEEARQEQQVRIDELIELSKKQSLTPEQDLELENRKDHLSRIADPSQLGSRADEIASDVGVKAFEAWLMPRLIEDEDGNLLFNPHTDIGKRRWRDLGKMTKEMLRLPFYQMLLLITKAKNYSTGQNSD